MEDTEEVATISLCRPIKPGNGETMHDNYRYIDDKLYLCPPKPCYGEVGMLSINLLKLSDSDELYAAGMQKRTDKVEPGSRILSVQLIKDGICLQRLIPEDMGMGEVDIPYKPVRFMDVGFERYHYSSRGRYTTAVKVQLTIDEEKGSVVISVKFSLLNPNEEPVEVLESEDQELNEIFQKFVSFMGCDVFVEIEAHRTGSYHPDDQPKHIYIGSQVR